MGVRGLLGYCLDHKSECVRYVDIVEVAKEKGIIEILVDFYAFMHYVRQRFWRTMTTVNNNPFMRLMGGEYAALDTYLTKLIADLRSCGIHLVMYVDGARGSSKTTMERKLQTWKDRYSQDMQKLRDNLDVIAGYKQTTDLSEDSAVRSVLLEVQMFETFKACNCEVVQCTAGEADYVLARNLMMRPQAFAIFSNDSDFCIFKDCRFIPCQLFDTNNDLRLGGMQKLPEKPQQLTVGVIHSSTVATLLQLEDESSLIELSIIAGNDFTGPFSRQLKMTLGLQERVHVTEVADWVRRYKCVEKHPAATDMMQRNRKLADLIRQSREFYSTESATREDMNGDTTNPLTQAIESAIKKGDLPTSMMGIHRGFYWKRIMLEDCHYGCPNVETALAPLRALMYRIVVPWRSSVVEEYGRSPAQEPHWTTVCAVPDCSFITFDQIQREKIFKNLRTFAHIMSYHEPDFPHKFMDLYGRRNGFIYLVLRFFLCINSGINLYVGTDEFLALVAMVVGRVDEQWYQALAFAPSVRSVTLASWFQAVYRHAYLFLGKLLYVSDEFPAPKHMFSGAVWTAFHIASSQQGQQHCHIHFPRELRRIRDDMDRILNDKKHIIPKLVEGIFNYRGLLIYR